MHPTHWQFIEFASPLLMMLVGAIFCMQLLHDYDDCSHLYGSPSPAMLHAQTLTPSVATELIPQNLHLKLIHSVVVHPLVNQSTKLFI